MAKKKTGTQIVPAAQAVQGDMLKAEAAHIIQAIMKIGAVKGLALATGTARLQTVMVFSELESSGIWKHLPGNPADPNSAPCALFKDAAEMWLGQSYRSLAEDRQNLQLLGEQYFTVASSLLPRASMRQLRRLPAETRAELFECADGALSAEQLKAKIEELAAELLDSREESDEKLAMATKATQDAKADLEASRKIADERAQKIQELQAEVLNLEVEPFAYLTEFMPLLQKHGNAAERALRELVKLTKVLEEKEVEHFDGLHPRLRDPERILACALHLDDYIGRLHTQLGKLNSRFRAYFGEMVDKAVIEAGPPRSAAFQEDLAADDDEGRA